MSSQYPRVTAILKDLGLGPDLSMVPAAVLGPALARGTAVHEAIEAHAYGYLEEDALAPEVAPYFSAYLKFLADSKHEPLVTEAELVHPAWRYRGHVDRVGFLNGARVVIDFKTGDATGVEYQVAAYVDAWNAEHPTEPAVGGLSLRLKDDGTYRLTEVDLPAAMRVWRAAVVVYQAKHRL